MILTLVVLGLVVACATWTLTKEELTREVREWARSRCDTARWLVTRKLCYMVTCEYCLSHYVAAVALLVIRPTPLLGSWLATWFVVVWVANVAMTAYGILRQVLKHRDAVARRACAHAHRAECQASPFASFNARVRQ